MPKQKYKLQPKKRNKIVVMSDLHLGEEECVLNDCDLPLKDFEYINREFYGGSVTDIGDLKEKRKGNINKLKKELNELDQIDELILLGDVLDFSLASLHEAYDNARRFFDVLLKNSPPPSIKEITYIPGNHDHHQWLQVFERYVVTEQIGQRGLPPDRHEYLRWFVDQDATAAFPANMAQTFLQGLLPPQVRIPINVGYPHIMRAVGDKNYYFTHGHFLQRVFKPVTEALPPEDFGELASFNSLWLEAIWYHLGQAGRLSFLVERIYEHRTDETFWKAVEGVISDLLSRINLTPSWYLKSLIPILWIARWIIKKCVISYLKRHPDHRRFLRVATSATLRGRDAEGVKREVKDYLEEDVFRFIDLPKPFTFIFGHTHKTTGLDSGKTTVPINGQTYTLENTGAWLENVKRENAGFFVIDSSKGLSWVPILVA